MDIGLVRLLGIFGKVNPAIWDAVFPHGPVLSPSSSLTLGSEVALNPQPLPPLEELHLASASVANEVARTAIAAEVAGTKSGAEIVAKAVDDWCGTPRGGLPIPWPEPWPLPWPPPGPEPEPDVKSSQIIGALTLASVASRMSGGEVRDALEKGAEQLMQAGLAE